MKYQYYCKDCGYKRPGLLDHPAIGIGSYSTTCPECNGQYDSKEVKCSCHTCNPIDYTKIETVYMRLCPICGNKRCPKATDHRNECTNSNEPNQEGSIY